MVQRGMKLINALLHAVARNASCQFGLTKDTRFISNDEIDLIYLQDLMQCSAIKNLIIKKALNFFTKNYCDSSIKKLITNK